MKKLASLILAGTLCLSMLAGCGSSEAASNVSVSGSSPEVAATTSTGVDTANFLKIVEATPDTVDTQCTTDYYTVGMNIFDRLVEVKANGDGTSEIVPSLAKSWDITPDGLTYTFHLEEGVKYSNGADFTASDVLYTIKRMLTYEKAVNGDIYDVIVGAEELASGAADTISGVVVVDDYTVEITLTQPYAAFLACLTTPGASMLDEETTEAAGDQFGIDPAVTIGTGPFIFDSWQFNAEMILVANPDCWSGAPACEGIVMMDIPDEATQRMMFENGELDLLDLDNASSQADYFLSNEAYADKIASGTRVGIYYIAINELHEALSHVEVRQALQHAIDRQAILDALYGGRGSVENGIFATGLIGHNNDLSEITYDVELAKELLAQGGYPDGFEMELCYSSDSSQTTKDLLEIVSAQLSQIGVTAKVVEVDEGSFTERRAAGELDAYTNSWSADFNDPDNFIYTFFGSADNSVRRGLNYTNQDAIDRVAAARGIVDETERVAEYQALEQLIIQDEAAWIPLFSKQHLYVVNDRVSGFTVSWNGWSSNYYRNVAVNG